MHFSRIVILPAAVAVLFLLAGGPGARFGLWGYRTGFGMMRWAFFLGLFSAAFALLFLLIPPVRSAHVALLLLTCAVGLACAYVPWSFLQKAHSVPAIHDITTDTADPPGFGAILPLRAGAPNPPGYDGEEVARKQHEAYPDIRPYRLKVDAGKAFERALAAARDMGWKIVAEDREAGRIEATATTLWYGFKDDVVVRVRKDDGGSVIDVRSKSRVGRSDLGTNAKRIRKYLKKIGSE